MTERLWNHKYVMLLAIDMTMQFGMYITRPIVSSFATVLGASLALAGFLAGLNATTSMVMRPITGIASDYFSKKNLLVFSCAFFVVSGVGSTFATSSAMLGVFCVVQGIAFAFRSAVIVSMTALVVPESKLATGVGWLGLSYTLGGALGPAIGSYLGNAFGYPICFALSSVLFAIGLFVAILFKAPEGAKAHAAALDDRKADDGKASRHVKISQLFYLPVIPLALIAGLLMVAQGTMNSFILLLGDMDIIQGAPLYFLVYSIIILGTRPLAGRICDTHGLGAIAVPCMIIAACGMLVLSFWRGPVAVVVAALFMGIGQASAYSSMQAESVRHVEESMIGRASNTFYIGPDIGMGLGPIVSGFVWSTFGATAMFYFVAGCIILGAIIFAVFWHPKSGAATAPKP